MDYRKKHIRIRKKYGKIDKDLGSKKGYYISEDNYLIMFNNQPLYYWMVYDENGIVYDVFVEGTQEDNKDRLK